MLATAAHNQAQSLFAWRERAEIDALAERRERLRQQISVMPKRSHKQLMLEGRLADLTRQILRLELKLRSDQ